MKIEYESYIENTEEELEKLSKSQKDLNEHYSKLKRKLTNSLKAQDKKFTKMTLVSDGVVKKFEAIYKKGETILHIVSSCRKLETEEERSDNWSNLRKKWYELFNLYDQSVEDKLLKKKKEEEISESDIEESIKVTDPKSEEEEIVIEPLPEEEKSLKQESVEEVVVETKPKKEMEEIVEDKEEEGEEEEDILEHFKYLECLKDLWWVHNRVETDIIDLKQKKIELQAENKRLRSIIKGILEDAAIKSRETQIKQRIVRSSICSAPASLSSSKCVPQLPNRVDIEF